MTSISEWFIELNTNYQWVITLFLLVFATLVVNFIWKRYYTVVQKRLKKTVNLWDDALWEALHKPMGYMIWILGISFAIEISQAPRLEQQVLDLLENVRAIAVLSLMAWFFFRFIHFGEENVSWGGMVTSKKQHLLSCKACV